MPDFGITFKEPLKGMLKKAADKYDLELGAAGRLMLAQRVQLENWDMYDKMMLSRLKYITSLDENGLKELDIALAHIVGGKTELRNNDVAGTTGTAGTKSPGRKRNHI